MRQPLASSPHLPLLALDIGGANIKVADGSGFAASWPFALWKHPDGLTAQLTHCLKNAPPANNLVVTMTGELCDCFETKAEGVTVIVQAMIDSASNQSVTFYQTDGRFVSASEAIASPLLTAASNWHALAQIAARYCEKAAGMLIDIGSTTMDVVPFIADKVAARGEIDPERMFHGELVYSGIERTPVCSVVSQLPWRNKKYPLARELFATTADAYLLLGSLPEDREYIDTADGKPFTREASHARLARMICGDRELVSYEEAVGFAQSIKEKQLELLKTAFDRVSQAMVIKPQFIVLSGHGEFLARQMIEQRKLSVETISLVDVWGSAVSRCAPAHALALLAQENVGKLS